MFMKTSPRTTATLRRGPLAAVLLAGALALTGCSVTPITDDVPAAPTPTEAGAESAAADSQSETGTTEATFRLEEGGVVSELTYIAEGDWVTSQTTRTVLDHAKLGLPDAGALREQFEPLAAQYAGIEGLEHHFEYGETQTVETLSIDYAVVDVAELAALPGSEFEGMSVAMNKVSLSASKRMLLDAGFTEVK